MVNQEVQTSDTVSSTSSSVGASPTFTPTQSSKRSPGLQIPEPTDGYFGYIEEKTLRHVRRQRLSPKLHTWKSRMDAVVVESVSRRVTYLTERIDRGKSVVAPTAISISVRGGRCHLRRSISRSCSGTGSFTRLDWSQFPPRHRWY